MATCQNVTHEIQRGDTLYRLAQRYRTTVPLILLANPGLNPNNLQIGTKIQICRGNQFVESPSMDELQLTGDMSKAMLQYVGWLKMYLVSLTQSADRQREVSQRVRQMPGRIADIFEVFYPMSMTSNMRERLLLDYTVNLMSYANAVKNRDTDAAEKFKEEASENAERLAELLATNNSNYNKDQLEDWLEELTEYVEMAVTDAQNRNQTGEFDGYDRMDQWAATVAMYLSDGLRNKFYREG